MVSGLVRRRTDGKAGELTRCRQGRGTGAAIKLKYCAAPRYFTNTNRLMTLAKSRLCGQILDRANL